MARQRFRFSGLRRRADNGTASQMLRLFAQPLRASAARCWIQNNDRIFQRRFRRWLALAFS
jgi:hypothetical protein